MVGPLLYHVTRWAALGFMWIGLGLVLSSIFYGHRLPWAAVWMGIGALAAGLLLGASAWSMRPASTDRPAWNHFFPRRSLPDMLAVVAVAALYILTTQTLAGSDEPPQPWRCARGEDNILLEDVQQGTTLTSASALVQRGSDAGYGDPVVAPNGTAWANLTVAWDGRPATLRLDIAYLEDGQWTPTRGREVSTGSVVEFGRPDDTPRKARLFEEGLSVEAIDYELTWRFANAGASSCRPTAP